MYRIDLARDWVKELEPQPWVDTHLPKEPMQYLWDAINNAPTEEIPKGLLAGNISKSIFIEDKNNWFYKNALQWLAEHLYYKNWGKYYETHVANIIPPPVFELYELWVNFQKQHEFNPPHHHGGLYSFVVFMKIPTHWKEQHELPWSKKAGVPLASNFQFLIGRNEGPVETVEIALSPEDEGRILFFPAWLVHQVFPFYGTEKERITVSGNILLQDSTQTKK